MKTGYIVVGLTEDRKWVKTSDYIFGSYGYASDEAYFQKRRNENYIATRVVRAKDWKDEETV